MTVLVVPKTGEAIPLDTASVEIIAAYIESLDETARDLRSQKREVADEMARRLDIEGSRSVRDDNGVKIEVNAPMENKWDVDELRAVLAELVAEGTISERKAKACVKFKPEPVWSQLKTLLSDPRCKARIGHCLTEVPATRYVKVTRA